MLGDLMSTGEFLAAVCLLCALPMVHPRTRRVTVAIMRFAKGHAPKWLLPALVVCAFIPGPLDELAVIAAVMFPVLRNAHNRRVFKRYVTYAWKG